MGAGSERERFEIRGLILSAEAAGEAHRRFRALTQERGILLCLRRVRRAAAQECATDLFDTAEMLLQPGGSGTFFIESYRPLCTRREIGSSYEALQYASKFSLFLQHNLREAVEAQAAFVLAQRVFDAFSHAAPETACAVFLKGLLFYARSEGYPVWEDWLKSLPPADQADICALAQNPCRAAQAGAPKWERLLQSLQFWLKHATEIYVD